MGFQIVDRRRPPDSVTAVEGGASSWHLPQSVTHIILTGTFCRARTSVLAIYSRSSREFFTLCSTRPFAASKGPLVAPSPPTHLAGITSYLTRVSRGVRGRSPSPTATLILGPVIASVAYRPCDICLRAFRKNASVPVHSSSCVGDKGLGT